MDMKLHELEINKSGGKLTTAAGTRPASIRGVAVRRIEVWLGYGSSEEQGREVEATFSEACIPGEIRYESAYPGIGNGAAFTIKDPTRRTQINLRADLPDEAWEKLAELDLEGRESIAWTWDDMADSWIEYDLSGSEDESPLGPSHPDVQ